ERRSPQPADLEDAFRHYALAEQLFEERGIEYPAAAVRRGALARILRPDRVHAILNAPRVVSAADRADRFAAAFDHTPQTAWRPDLAGLDLSNQADIASLTGQAILALKNDLELGFDLDVLRAEILRGQAKALPKGDPARVRLLQSAQSLFETELNR